MSEYRRYFVRGGSYFFTLVTYGRARLFHDERARSILGQAMRVCFERYPVEVAAVVLLPDHLHTLWTLPRGDDRFAPRWAWIKREFTRAWLSAGGHESHRPTAYAAERRRAVWQRRFWEHSIRDERDFEAHFDYIHYNPVKHRLAARPRDWQWSSFHRWVDAGHYDINWGAGATMPTLPGNAGE